MFANFARTIIITMFGNFWQLELEGTLKYCAYIQITFLDAMMHFQRYLRERTGSCRTT